jgi:hypothetical protein
MNENTFYNELLTGPVERFTPTKSKTLTTELMRITPRQARYILKTYNTKNRKPSKVAVTKYATDMQSGNWQLTAQTIAFDRDQVLLDGQQRLLACVQTDMPQDFLVAFGLSPDCFKNIDNGKGKTNADILGMNGFGEPAITSALTRAIIAYETSGTTDANTFKGVYQITKSQILEYLDAHPEITQFIDKYKKSQVVSSLIASFCYWLLSQDNRQECEKYLDQVLLGYNLEPDTIQSYLFNKLQRNRNTVQQKMTKTSIIANIIIGWKRYMGYSKSKSLQITWDVRKGIPSPFQKNVDNDE